MCVQSFIPWCNTNIVLGFITSEATKKAEIWSHYCTQPPSIFQCMCVCVCAMHQLNSVHPFERSTVIYTYRKCVHTPTWVRWTRRRRRRRGRGDWKKNPINNTPQMILLLSVYLFISWSIIETISNNWENCANRFQSAICIFIYSYM